MKKDLPAYSRACRLLSCPQGVYVPLNRWWSPSSTERVRQPILLPPPLGFSRLVSLWNCSIVTSPVNSESPIASVIIFSLGICMSSNFSKYLASQWPILSMSPSYSLKHWSSCWFASPAVVSRCILGIFLSNFPLPVPDLSTLLCILQHYLSIWNQI